MCNVSFVHSRDVEAEQGNACSFTRFYAVYDLQDKKTSAGHCFYSYCETLASTAYVHVCMREARRA